MTAAHDSTAAIELPPDLAPASRGGEEHTIARRPNLIVPLVKLSCPAGHRLDVPAEYAADGHEIFCPTCRQAFRAGAAAERAARRRAQVGFPRCSLKEVEARARLRRRERRRAARALLVRRAKSAVVLLGRPLARCLGPAAAGFARLLRRKRPTPTATAAGAGTTVAAVPARPAEAPVVKVSPRTFRRLLSASTWTASGALHAAVLVAVAVLGIRAQPPPEEPEVILTTTLTVPRELDIEEPRKRDLFTNERRKDQSEAAPDLPEVNRPDPARTETEPLSERPPSGPPEAVIADVPMAMPPSLLKSPRKPRFAPIGVGGGEDGLSGSGEGPAPEQLKLRTTAEGRLEAAKAGGGGEDTENAVEKALAWLARNQQKDGSWSPGGLEPAAPDARAFVRAWDNRYTLTGTAFAVLAYLGAGHAPGSQSKYAGNISKGIAYLQAQLAEEDPVEERLKGMSAAEREKFFDDWLVKTYGQSAVERWTPAYRTSVRASVPAMMAQNRAVQCMYTRGICTFALAEAYSLTRDPEIGKAAQRGVDFIIKAQAPYGGWDYGPSRGVNSGIDQSVTIWCLLALRAGRMAGLKVDGAGFEGVRKWLDACQLTGAAPGGARNEVGGAPVKGTFAYRGTVNRGSISANRGTCGGTMTAAGLMMRLYTGSEPTSAQCVDPANVLLAHFSGGARMPLNPGERIMSVDYDQDIYFFYHATVPMFQMGGDHWKRWNEIVKPIMLKSQARDGKDDGSWPPERCYQSRTMATALGAMTLEVYYRYLRIYERDKEK